jgi:hypothetical protein
MNLVMIFVQPKNQQRIHNERQLDSRPTPIGAARWLGGGALIRPIEEIVRSIDDFNSLCSFGGSNFKSPVCLGATVAAVVIFRARMVHRVGNGCGVDPLSTSFRDHSRGISYRAPPPSCAYPMASLGRFHAAVASSTSME